MTPAEKQRVVSRRMPGYVVRPRPERHGKPETGDRYFATIEQLKERYARRMRRG